MSVDAVVEERLDYNSSLEGVRMVDIPVVFMLDVRDKD